MYWPEKLDILKKKYSSSEFRDMFREGGNVIEKIIRKFHYATYMTFTESDNRKSLLKNCELVKETTVLGADRYLDELEDNINYWQLFVRTLMGNDFQVYDCSKKPLLDLYYLSSSIKEQEFYIVDKKYKWLLYFVIDRNENNACIYKSNNEQ